MRMRILNAEPENYDSQARAILERIGDLVEQPTSPTELPERLVEFEILIVRLGLRVDAGALRRAERLRFVVTATTGLDHIDLEATRLRGIEVLSLQGETEFLRTVPATAELTWALLLAVIRRLPWGFQHVLAGGWERNPFRGRDLAGKRLGILGLGRLGRMLAGYGQAFGMQVSAHDPFAADWPSSVQRYASAEDLLEGSDVLTVHLPLGPETERFLDARRLALLPAGAILINTSRGAILDEEALLDALQSGHLGGAGLDVLASEGQRRDKDPLLDYARCHDNLLITPHLGGASFDSMARTEIFMARKLETAVSRLQTRT